MDISKILDFHRMVMMSEGQQAMVDETACGPLCQHPACWASNRRCERGVPHINTHDSDDEDDETDLPTVKYYNMLEDYGDSPTDRFPARFGGRAMHERSSSMRNVSHPLRTPSLAMATAPFTTPVSPDKTMHPTGRAPVRLVEVQEVFDTADLNSRWDETFMTRQFLVWVPNPSRRSLQESDATPRKQLQPQPSAKSLPLLPKDLTESMVPLEIKQQREDSILQKKQARTSSPLFRHGTYPKTPNDGAKPDVDTEGIRELLGLPRDVLVEVLERAKESDFVSKEKIHGIVEEVLSTARNRESRTARTVPDFTPRRSAIDTSDVLRQQKLQLHQSAQRNIRSSYTLPQQPVFHLDDDSGRLSSVGSVHARAVSDIDSTPGRDVKGLPHYKKPLPAIPDMSKQTTPRRELSLGQAGPDRMKIPSVSLGLPELPSGLRHTRAFAYNNRHRPDFTLVPVPTPPTSVRSSGSEPSGHGTTMRVNLPSVSDLEEADYYDLGPMALPSTSRLTNEDGVLHLVSPALSTKVPQAPAGTPATFHSPTKSLMYRDLTVTSSVQAVDGGRSMPPSRDITMSPGHKIVLGGSVPPDTAPAADEQGLDTIRETARENGAASSMKSSQYGRNVQFAEPRPPPSTPQDKASGPQESRGEGDGLQPPKQTVEGSPEYWPQVTESSYDLASGVLGSRSDPMLMGEQSMLAEHGSAVHRGRSDLGSRGSTRSSLARRILDEGTKDVESPAPPPPSPEPKELSERSLNRNKRETKSRESVSMEPLKEQSESEGSVSPQKGVDKKSSSESKSITGQTYSIDPVIKEEVTPSPQSANLNQAEDPVAKVMVSHVAPRPSGSREKLQQTFMNVDIPAEDVSSLQAEQGSSGPSDFTSSVTTSPEKMSPGKGPTPKSSPGPSSPVKKAPKKSSPQTSGSGGRKKERRESKVKKASPSQSPVAADESLTKEQ